MDKPKIDFVLNNSKYARFKNSFNYKKILGVVPVENMLLGHLKDYGFDVIIAPSFADIFYNNCFKNGILPIILDPKYVQDLFDIECEITIDLENQTIIHDHKKIHFDIDGFRKKTLLEGLDDIALTLQYNDKITEYETRNSN